MTAAPALVRIARRVRLPADEADDLAATCAAVLGTSAPDSVLASLTAARLHGLWLPAALPPAIHVATARPGAVGRAMTRSRRPELVSHRFQLRGEDVVLVGGLPVTSPARTFRDVAAVLSFADLVALGDCALRFGATGEQLEDAVRHNPNGRGCRAARRALPMLDARSRSRPESHLRMAATHHRLPRFEVNMPVFRDEGGWLAEPDLSLSEAKIALEYQGEDHAEVARMRNDITRSTDLRREDWLVIEYGPAEVFRRPWQIAPELLHHVRTRAPHLLVSPVRPTRVVSPDASG